ncbi:hypothetical protein P171DRAFT_200115 [Karstenula rhodostoma CBS 690.94]|uniref:Uncharacterized protein n=1 Tax=Karstenula rhodostoma CBS 690.94 TaxID=1392251 RepID=A0A9P4PTA5_9PLEO|nr:hypothetical protein P171DRAFT_200115 [Karstenula rhodostoma CBS 690.94]
MSNLYTEMVHPSLECPACRPTSTATPRIPGTALRRRPRMPHPDQHHQTGPCVTSLPPPLHFCTSSPRFLRRTGLVVSTMTKKKSREHRGIGNPSV